MKVRNKCRLTILLYTPLWLVHVIAYLFSSKKTRRLIDEDIHIRPIPESGSKVYNLIFHLVMSPDYRAVFYLRIGHISHFLSLFLHPIPCMLGNMSDHIQGGLYIDHGYGTVINGMAIIGKNSHIMQSVTIGLAKGGIPTIGNNVFIGAGAIIIGGVSVGDNVKIGAGAVVVEDVPDNCTVVGPKSRIINRQI